MNSTKNSQNTLSKLLTDIKTSRQRPRTAGSCFQSTFTNFNSENSIYSVDQDYDQDEEDQVIQLQEVDESYAGYRNHPLRKSQSFGDQKKELQLHFDRKRGRRVMTIDVNDAGLPVSTFHNKRTSVGSSSSTTPIDRRPSPAAVLMTPLPKFDETTQKRFNFGDRANNSTDSLSMTKRGRVSLTESSRKDQNKSNRRISHTTAGEDKKNSSRRKISSYTNGTNISDRYLRSLATWADKVEAADKKEDPNGCKNADEIETRLNPVRVKFIKLCRIVRLFIRVCTGMKEYAFKNNSSSFIDLNYYTVDNGNRRSKSLAFSKKEYARSRTMHMPQWARSVLWSAPESRSHTDLLNLRNLFRGLGCFDRFPNHVQMELVRHFEFCRYEEGRVVLRQGHEGFCFYMIFHGSLSVSIEEPDSKGKTYSRMENILTSGVSFGELALISKTKRRTATVKARENVELLSIDDRIFQKYCADEFLREHEAKIEKTRLFKIFNDWSDELLSEICFEAQLREYKHGKIIDCNTTSSLSINFLMEGKCDCLREVDLNKVPKEVKKPCIQPGQRLNTPLSASVKTGTKSHLNSKVLLYVGSLKRGDACDLLTLSDENAPGFTLVSAGAKILRISKKRLKLMAPSGWLNIIKLESKNPIMLTSNEELCRRYTEFENWQGFKSMTLNETLLKIKGHDLAQMPATKKGSSGWAKWPGQADSINRQRETSDRLSTPAPGPSSLFLSFTSSNSTKIHHTTTKEQPLDDAIPRESSSTLQRFRQRVQDLRQGLATPTSDSGVNSNENNGNDLEPIRRSRTSSNSLINDKIRQKFLRPQIIVGDEDSASISSYNADDNGIRPYLRRRQRGMRSDNVAYGYDDAEDDVIADDITKTNVRLSKIQGSLGSIYQNRNTSSASKALYDKISSEVYSI
ncbi:uncharacterized protein TRIADDRAFT_52117 [Trichoplax adhaerens]|uniref:Cyclic nucleotide-binding domain-containing protein n=1 Tax=Trichoplax adhaerens TaxID=10228 RepID=B3RLT5_TRIAD|nr:hypothetical protein TRIADDRAFT_52117 [Trichoplax adhaerens]EDV29581.1 hypothetical protein TRIADDRAFT_52117 [Trichoplax adhaerens]|eukprot:XP_002108783.1 hypothetical protein TRIADDRAFT_52117 [Trichoplax adhaerens]